MSLEQVWEDFELEDVVVKKRKNSPQPFLHSFESTGGDHSGFIYSAGAENVGDEWGEKSAKRVQRHNYLTEDQQNPPWTGSAQQSV